VLWLLGGTTIEEKDWLVAAQHGQKVRCSIGAEGGIAK
jgi:hypothetical protein